MSIQLSCGQCHAALQFKEEWAGKNSNCPTCGAPLVIPALHPGGTAASTAMPPQQKPPPAVSSLPVLPEGNAKPDYAIDLGAWFRYSGGARNNAFTGPMIGFFFILLGIAFVFALLSFVFVGVLGYIFVLPQLAAGPTIVCLAQLKGEPWTFGDFFGGFRRYGTWLVIELLATLFPVAGALPGILVAILLAIINGALGIDPEPGSAWSATMGLIILTSLLAGVLGSIYIWFRTCIFVRQIIIETDCGPIEGFKRSWRLTRGHFWGLFGSFLLMMLIIYFAAAVTCGIGMLFALPRGLLFWNTGYLFATGRRPLEPT